MSDRKIRIGNQTAFSASYPLDPFEFASANGFDAFEWFPDKKDSGEGWEEGDMDMEMRLYIKEKSMSEDISLSVHAPWQANPLKAECRPLFERSIEFARDIGAGILIIHHFNTVSIEAFVEAVMPVAGLCADSGIRLSIENTPHSSPEDFNSIFTRINSMRGIDRSLIGMCLDIGHANLHTDTHNNYLSFIDRLDADLPIIHVHLHENHGDFDSHILLFQGPAGNDPKGVAGFMERLGKRKFNGSMILEQWPNPPELLCDTRRRLFQMMGGDK